MDCPVCFNDAKDVSPSTYRGLVVECPRCGLYRLTRGAIAGLVSLNAQERMAALRIAKMVGALTRRTVSASRDGVAPLAGHQDRAGPADQVAGQPDSVAHRVAAAAGWGLAHPRRQLS